jgi:DNA-directed RNA polymerase subunit M/transcription elongation factor TFIIS
MQVTLEQLKATDTFQRILKLGYTFTSNKTQQRRLNLQFTREGNNIRYVAYANGTLRFIPYHNAATQRLALGVIPGNLRAWELHLERLLQLMIARADKDSKRSGSSWFTRMRSQLSQNTPPRNVFNDNGAVRVDKPATTPKTTVPANVTWPGLGPVAQHRDNVKEAHTATFSEAAVASAEAYQQLTGKSVLAPPFVQSVPFDFSKMHYAKPTRTVVQYRGPGVSETMYQEGSTFMLVCLRCHDNSMSFVGVKERDGNDGPRIILHCTNCGNEATIR